MKTRMLSLLGLIIVALVLSASYYLQTFDGMTPCPLCILQRYTMMILGILFLIGILCHFKKTGRVFLGLFSSIFSGLGIFLAGRQVWIQHLPPNQNTDCGASLEYMLQALPIKQVIQKIFSGSAECSKVDWRLFTLSLAEWSLICFCVLFMLSMLVIFSDSKKIKQKRRYIV